MDSQVAPGPKPRIAILSRNFSKSAGGAENYAVNLAEQVLDAFDVHVFCERSDHVHPGITLHRMGWNLVRPRWMALWLFAGWSWLRTRRGFAIVHSHENTWHGDVQTAHVRPMRFNLFASAKTPFSRFLVYLKIFTSPRLLAHVGLERLRFRAQGRRVVVAVAPALGELIAQTFAIDKNRVRFVPPGIHLPAASAHGHEAGARQAQARETLGLPKDAWIIMLVGHNFEKKGLVAVLRSLNLLPTDVALLVVGGGTKQVKIWRSRCIEHGLDGRVFFAGTLPDAAIAFAAANCLVHATLDDTVGMVALEAMAARIPVLLSAAPYCLYADAVNQAGAAWIIQNPHSEGDIAQALSTLRSDQSLCQAQVARGILFSRSHEWSSIGSMQALIYQEFLP